MSTPNTSRDEAPERRETARRPVAAPVRVVLDAVEFEGTTENVSEAGVLLTTPDRLRVTVVLDEDGRETTRRGRVVRVQRVDGERLGLAIEFDDR